MYNALFTFKSNAEDEIRTIELLVSDYTGPAALHPVDEEIIKVSVTTEYDGETNTTTEEYNTYSEAKKRYRELVGEELAGFDD